MATARIPRNGLISESSHPATQRQTDARATGDSGGSRSSGERTHEDGGLDKAAGHRPRRLFGTHTIGSGYFLPEAGKTQDMVLIGLLLMAAAVGFTIDVFVQNA